MNGSTGDTSHHNQPDLAAALKASLLDRREVVDSRLEWPQCEACGHRMIRFSGRCWSDCDCASGKHAGRDTAGSTP